MPHPSWFDWLTVVAAQEKTATSGLSAAGPVVHGTPDDPLRDPREIHLRHVKQLTFGGLNADAYFSYDGCRLIFMSTRPTADGREAGEVT